MAKEYVGRFPVNKGLTKALNYKDFVIYRDPEIGLYAYSSSLDLEVNLLDWNRTVKEVKDNPSIIRMWQVDIERALMDDGTEEI